MSVVPYSAKEIASVLLAIRTSDTDYLNHCAEMLARYSEINAAQYNARYNNENMIPSTAAEILEAYEAGIDGAVTPKLQAAARFLQLAIYNADNVASEPEILCVFMEAYRKIAKRII